MFIANNLCKLNIRNNIFISTSLFSYNIIEHNKFESSISFLCIVAIAKYIDERKRKKT